MSGTSMKTKTVLYGIGILLLFWVLSGSCNNSAPQPGWVKVTFTGVDYSMCMCCGGYYFTLNGKKYRALSVVKNSVLDEHTPFPKDYFIQFQIPSGACYGGGEFPVVKVMAIKNVARK